MQQIKTTLSRRKGWFFYMGQNCPKSLKIAPAIIRPAAPGTKEMEPGVARRAVEPGRALPAGVSVWMGVRGVRGSSGDQTTFR